MKYLAKLSMRLARLWSLSALALAIGVGACTDQPLTAPASPDAPEAGPPLAALTATTCQASGTSWTNTAFAAQTGTFTATYDATPGAAAIDGVTGLGATTVTDYSGLAAIVRFNTTGKIDARNGGAYAAAASIPYQAGTTYHVRLVVNVPARTYSAYVTPAGGAELTIGLNYAFRSEQGTATSLADFGAKTSTGSLNLCALNAPVSAAPAPVPVASVTLSPASVSLLTGATQQLTATVKDSAGNTLTGRTVTWSSSATTVATVGAGGLVTAVAAGTAAITATSEGRSATAAIAVSAPAPSPCTPSGSGVCRYVDAVNGNDAGAGTSSAPFRTIQKAASVVNPGDVVIVRNGTYTGGTNIVNIGRSGTAAAWITFRAEKKWGAVIDGQNNTSVTGFEVGSQYIRIEGFEIRGTSRYGIEAYGGANVTLAQNHVHHIGRYCTSTTGGIVGLNAYVPNLTIEQNVVHDIGRFANGENGCVTTNGYWQNHDHGVYQGEGDNLVVRNNVFYNMTRGWAFQRYSGSGHVVSNLQIVNNTFIGANPNKDGQVIIATGVTGLVISNNIFFQPRTAGVYFDNPGTVTGTMGNNLVTGASLTTGSATAVLVSGTLSSDPRFVNAAGGDFHLQSGSPAIDAGLTLSVVPNDLDGTLRPSGARYDIGASEYR